MRDLFRLDGRVAFISGASGHLGKAMAWILAEAGAHVILNARDRKKLESTVNELKKEGLDVSAICFDVTNEKAIKQHVKKINDKHKRLDILVHNANEAKPNTFDASTRDDFSSSYNVAVTASFLLLRAMKPLLQKTARKNHGGSSVIQIASMYGMVSPDPTIYGKSGQNSAPYYGAAKSALIQFTRYAACHLAPLKIRVNAISPGPFPSSANPSFLSKLRQKNPLGRVGQPEELQGPLLFLASDASSFVTGINLPVDGGWTAW